jgi:hypothetical protein
MEISAEAAAASRAKTVAAMDRLEREFSPSGYLVGDTFTVADLTAAALFYGVARPTEFPYPMVADNDLPGSWREFLDPLAQRPGAQWVAEMYRQHRGRSAEITPAEAASLRRDLTLQAKHAGAPEQPDEMNTPAIQPPDRAGVHDELGVLREHVRV